MIVHGYAEWGVDIASKLDGDFAFVILDENTGEVYAARDHVGVNSMYMGQVGQGAETALPRPVQCWVQGHPKPKLTPTLDPAAAREMLVRALTRSSTPVFGPPTAVSC